MRRTWLKLCQYLNLLWEQTRHKQNTVRRTLCTDRPQGAPVNDPEYLELVIRAAASEILPGGTELEPPGLAHLRSRDATFGGVGEVTQDELVASWPHDELARG